MLMLKPRHNESKPLLQRLLKFKGKRTQQLKARDSQNRQDFRRKLDLRLRMTLLLHKKHLSSQLMRKSREKLKKHSELPMSKKQLLRLPMPPLKPQSKNLSTNKMHPMPERLLLNKRRSKLMPSRQELLLELSSCKIRKQPPLLRKRRNGQQKSPKTKLTWLNSRERSRLTSLELLQQPQLTLKL